MGLEADLGLLGVILGEGLELTLGLAVGVFVFNLEGSGDRGLVRVFGVRGDLGTVGSCLWK